VRRAVLPLLLLLLAGTAYAGAALQEARNVPYDGRFTFVRLRVKPSGGAYMSYTPPWAHDYPTAERNLMRIVDELSLLGPHVAESNILDLDDPELFKHPIAYFSEPGYWEQSDEEARSLRLYLLKGGFVIFDDFRGGDLRNFREQMERVLPGAELFPLDLSHPIFNSFFRVESLEGSAPTFRRYRPVYYAIYERNDPTGRMLAVVNYNNDLGEYWEFDQTGFFPVDMSNEAHKLGVNYIVYGMTH